MSETYGSREERKQLERRIKAGVYLSREERKQVEKKTNKHNPVIKKAPQKKDHC
ncbi:hypothetical protein GCM10020331_000790 [Ectobacillus funiculus]